MTEKLTQLPIFTVASYTGDGIYQNSCQINSGDLDSAHVDYFRKACQGLSGDLELPYEDKLPGEFEYMEYRIGSDLNGAYVLFYFHDEVIFATLLLSGTDEEVETELMQVFKYLLLDTTDEDEPTEEEIEKVLASSNFDFAALSDRPIAFEVMLSAEPDEEAERSHVVRMGHNLAAAFFSIER